MKKTTKRILLLLLFSLCLLGCSKSDDGPDNTAGEFYFSFKVDGVQVSYEYTPDTQINLTGILDHDTASGLYAINIAGIDDIFETTLTNRLTIFLGDSNNFTTGISYTNIEGQGDSTPDSLFTMGYFDAVGNLYSAGMNITATPLYELATVRFTEITDSHISGSFSGTLTWYDTSGGTVELVGSVTITEGVFKVPRF
ncbi:hypothetical protein [Flagellimonas amoyensis]|uniref:hypothetical protein n=1 Tax=Flagellimonas amoyensis TaxID=2169401 RepID=UPI00131EDB66|nr:hypothetical protein [Allomuricauda amoyensis]